MKKRIVICILAVCILAVFVSVIAVALQGEKNVFVDLNGKVVDPDSKFQDTSSRTKEIKKQIIENEEREKANPPAISRTDDDDFSELRQKEEAAKKEAEYLLDLFDRGIKIVNKYSDADFIDGISNLQEVDRDLLEAMVSVFEKNLPTQGEADTLKECLAQKYNIVLTDDPIYQRMNAILHCYE